MAERKGNVDKNDYSQKKEDNSDCRNDQELENFLLSLLDANSEEIDILPLHECEQWCQVER